MQTCPRGLGSGWEGVDKQTKLWYIIVSAYGNVTVSVTVTANENLSLIPFPLVR